MLFRSVARLQADVQGPDLEEVAEADARRALRGGTRRWFGW